MTELRRLMETATDRVDAPDLAAAAVHEARRRRTRRRATVAVTAAVTALLVVVGVVRLETDDARSVAPIDTPSPSTPHPSAPSPSAAADPASQPVWDPFDLVDAPGRDSRLPSELEPPTAPPPLGTAPGVVAAWTEEGSDVRVLDTAGGWWTVPGTADAVAGTLSDVVRPAISSDGSRLALSTSAGIRIVDVITGDDRTLPWPEQVAPPWDTAPRLLWLPGDDGLVVLHWRRTWLVGLDGEDRQAPYREGYVVLGVDPAGLVYQNDYGLRRLITWDGDARIGDAPFVQCERLTAGAGLVACTTGSLQPGRSGPVVVDPADGRVVAYAPIRDPSAVYSDNGHLTALGFLDEDSVLLLVGPADFRTDEPEVERWHLVDWDFRAGTFEVLSTGGAGMREVVVAPGLVR